MTLVVWSTLLNCTKNRTLCHVLATMAYVYTACAVHVTIFSTTGKFRPISNFMELHALTLAARSYALLIAVNVS